MSKIIELQYDLSMGENIQYIHADEYVAVRRENEKYVIHCQTRYGSELETRILEAIIEKECSNNLIHLQFNTIGANHSKFYPLNLGDLKGISFPVLKSLIIPSQLYKQNTLIYDGENEKKENGTISEVLKGCPKLQNLVLPCCPDSQFHNVKLKELESLKVMSCFPFSEDRFINLLSKMPKKNLPELETLSYISGVEQEKIEQLLETPIGKQLKYVFLD